MRVGRLELLKVCDIDFARTVMQIAYRDESVCNYKTGMGKSSDGKIMPVGYFDLDMLIAHRKEVLKTVRPNWKRKQEVFLNKLMEIREKLTSEIKDV